MSGPDERAAERVAEWSDLPDRDPRHARVAGVDLVVVRYDDEVSVMYGRCLHRGVLLGDGHVDGENLICGVHGWDYRVDTGISEYDNSEVLATFSAWIDEDADAVYVDTAEVAAWADENPQPYGDPGSVDGGAGAMQGATDAVDGGAVDPAFYGEPDHETEPYTDYLLTAKEVRRSQRA